jgi:hypothetical protein
MLKILFTDYEHRYAILELIGEWNDCIYSDIMTLRREITDLQQKEGITKLILVAENVLNYHAAEDNCYYEEWYDEIADEEGWIAIVNPLDHVADEMLKYGLQDYVHILTGSAWRATPVHAQMGDPTLIPSNAPVNDLKNLSVCQHFYRPI